MPLYSSRETGYCRAGCLPETPTRRAEPASDHLSEEHALRAPFSSLGIKVRTRSESEIWHHLVISGERFELKNGHEQLLNPVWYYLLPRRACAKCVQAAP